MELQKQQLKCALHHLWLKHPSDPGIFPRQENVPTPARIGSILRVAVPQLLPGIHQPQSRDTDGRAVPAFCRASSSLRSMSYA